VKNILFISSIVLLSSAVYAQDPLNGTSWKTIDDRHMKPEVLSNLGKINRDI
jgi:hypothetical protein